MSRRKKNGGKVPEKSNHEYSITDEYEAMPSRHRIEEGHRRPKEAFGNRKITT